MPGLASADPHTLPTLSISRMNGQQRGSSGVSPGRNMEPVHLTEQSRAEQSRGSLSRKGHSSQIDVRAAEESLSLYCKPVELYNIIQRRAQRKPFFLQRCLSYKIEAAHQRRIKLSITVIKVSALTCDIRSTVGKPNGRCSGPGNDLQEQLFQSVLVMLTSPVSMQGMGYTGFRLSQTRILRAISVNSRSAENMGQSSTTFVLPEVRKLLLSAKKDGAVILFITSADLNPGCNGNNAQIESSMNNNQSILWGSISLATLCQTWLHPSNTNGHVTGTGDEISEGFLRLDLYPSKLQLVNLSDGRCVKLQSASSSYAGKSTASLQLRISGEEFGRNGDKVSSSGTGNVPSSLSVPQARRLQPGQVVFHYHYYFNQLYKSEVTENYSCPFCVLCCSSLKGLRCHLNSTHDLFSFEFLATSDYRLVNVFCRNDVLGPEGNVRDMDGLNDPRLKNFVYWSKSGRRRKTVVKIPGLGSTYVEETPSRGIDGLQRGLSSKDSVCSGQGALSLPLKHRSSSPEQRAGRDVLVTQCLQGNEANQIIINDPVKVTCSSAITQLADSLPNSGALHGHSRKHERSENEGQLLKVDEQASQVVKRQISERLTLNEARLHNSLDQVVANIGPNGVCLAIAAPLPSQERRPQANSRPQIIPSTSKAEKNRKNLVERSEARIRVQLQKRQFFHSHTAQPMALEQLLSDRDSEDEVDDVIADLEDRRMLDDFVDVTQDEKELMHMWNSFVRKQRVLADGHCPWACEAFTKLHARKFAECPTLRRCLMLFLTKLWNHHLVDGNTMNRCLLIVELFEKSQRT